MNYEQIFGNFDHCEMVRKKVPDYLLRVIDDYLSDRWVIYEGDK